MPAKGAPGRSRSIEISPANKAWLEARMDQLGITKTALGEKLGLDKSSTSRMFNSGREWYAQEIIDVAAMLNTPLLDFLPRLGLKLHATSHGTSAQIPVVGTVTEQGAYKSSSGQVSSGTPAAQEAVRVQAPGVDQAVLFLGAPCAPAQAVGRLCLVEHDDQKGVYALRRGSEDHLFTLLPPLRPEDRVEDVTLGDVRPVLWAKL